MTRDELLKAAEDIERYPLMLQSNEYLKVLIAEMALHLRIANVDPKEPGGVV